MKKVRNRTSISTPKNGHFPSFLLHHRHENVQQVSRSQKLACIPTYIYVHYVIEEILTRKSSSSSKFPLLILLMDILSASVGAGKVAVRVQIKRLGADVDNNHTNILCAVTAY